MSDETRATMGSSGDVTRIAVTVDERASGSLTPDRLAAARHAILEDGFVVLDDVIPVEQVDTLRERMHQDVPELERRAEEEPRRWAGHLQHQPPMDPAFLFPEVIAPPVLVAVCRDVMGEDIQLVLFTANTNLPGSSRQGVHTDLNQLFPDATVAPPPHQLISSVPLIDTSVANATELWPGTHLDTRTYGRTPFQIRHIPEDWLEARRAERPPVQVPQRRGSVLLRDPRVWHAGVPNTSGAVRVMLTISFSPTWYAATPITWPSSARQVVEQLAVPVPSIFTDKPFDQLDPWYSGLHGPQMFPQGRTDPPFPRKPWVPDRDADVAMADPQ
jgi:hypothetical protein